MAGNDDQPGLPLETAENGMVGRAPFVPQPRERVGRPPGATNKTSLQLSRYAAAKGLRDPGVMQLEFCNADPVELLAWMREADDTTEVTIDQVVAMQLAVADRVHPYFRGKVPVVAEIGETVPVFVMRTRPLGQAGDQARSVGPRRMSILDATVVKEAETREISGGDGAASHETDDGGEGEGFEDAD